MEGMKVMATLQIDPDKVCSIVVMAREFEAQEEPPTEDRGENASDEDFRSVLLAYPDDPTFEELTALIDGLNEDEQTALVALVWLGREDYTAEDWEQAVRDAAERRTGPTSRYLLGMPLLPDYLEAGLNQLGHSCEA